MSHVGKTPILVPQGVKVNFQEGIMIVEGPKGKLRQEYNSLVSFEAQENTILVKRANDEKQSRAYHGLYRNLLNNMIIGVSSGFSKTLIITGVGYKADVKDRIMILSLGFSTDIYVSIPDGLTVTAEPNGRLIVSGNNKQQVGEFAAQIRKLRAPEPYKGKGIRYENEIIIRKAGKKGNVK